MLKKWLSRFVTTTFTTTMLLSNVFPAGAAEGNVPTYLNSRASVEDRVKDLLGRMTLEQKVAQMVQGERKATTTEDVKNYQLGSVLSGGGSLPANNTAEGWADMIDAYQDAALSSELKIPILYGVDAVHGHNNVYGATIFPHNIGLGATGNEQLVEKVGQAVAKEVRATGVNWTFAPTLGIPHNERWGRTYEAFGENTELVAKMGKAYIKGLQGENPDRTLKRDDKVIATAKHYIGEGLTQNGTNQGNVVISEEDFQKALKEELLPPYKAAVDAGVRSVMVSYNSINGVKCHANADLITKVLKQDLGFKGIVISDYDGIARIEGTSQKDKIARAINAGVDMSMESTAWKGFMTDLIALVNEGKVSEERIDDAVTRILTVKFEMGLFEDPYAQRDLLNTVGSSEHRELSRQAVRESLVLLKNDNDVVGQLKNKKNILVAGKSADDIGIQSGGWTITWQGSSGNITPGTTILQGIKESVGDDVKVSYNKRGRASVDNDVAIVVIGETPYSETDGDRTPDKLTLDADDLLTLKNIKETNPNLPVVVVLVTGRPITIADQVEDFDGLVAAWLPGTEGQGVADVLFGNYDFTGKLTMTWPWYAEDITSKHEEGKALFNYGFGLKKGQTAELPEKPEKVDTPSLPIPGKVETEAYTTQSGFDFEDTSDVGGGKNAGWTDAGDWLDYYINVAEDGKYKVEFRVASPDGAQGGLELLLGSKTLTKVDAPKTNGYQAWQTIEGTVNLKAGKQTIRFKANAGGINFNWMNFVRIGDYEQEPETPPVTYEPKGQIVEKNAVEVYMSSSEQSGSMSWYDAPKEISNKLDKKDNLDITSPDGQEATTINVNSSKTYQSFVGMGTSMEESTVNNLAKMSKEKRTEFLTKLLDPEKGAGMSLLRVTIGTADFTGQEFYTYYDEIKDTSNPDWYNVTGNGFSIQKDIDYKIVDTIKEALAINPNVKIFASSWTPPGWMKLDTSSSKSYQNNEKLLKGGKLNDDYIDDLAKYYIRFMEEYAKLGIPMYAMTLQNEPELEIDYPSCRMSPEQERKLAIAIKAEVAKSSVLKANKIDPKVWAFDHNFNSAVSYVSPILNDLDGYAAVDGVAFHDYGGEPTAMTQVHNLYPEKSMNLTERSVWGTTGADRIIQYFRNYAETYTSWVTMLDSNIAPEQWTGTPDPTMLVQDANDRENYWATPEYYIAGQFSKFIRPGAVRIDTNYGSKDTVTNVAFKNTDGSIVMVVVNQTSSDQKFKILSDGVQIGGVVPAKNVATYKWNPVEGISEVPGTILAKDFSDNNGGKVVDDGEAGSHIGELSTGNWFDYIVNVKEAGLYNIKFLAASGTWNDGNGVEQNTDRKITVTQGEKIIGSTSITNAWWDKYKDNSTTVSFDKVGVQKIRLNITGTFDFRSMKLEKVKEVHNLPGRIEAENFTNANGVVIENGAVGYMEKDDFISYKVNVAESGSYDLNMLVSAGASNGSFDVYSNDVKLSTISFAKTTNWETWEDRSSNITLLAGEQILKFVVKEGFNLDYFTVGAAIKLNNSDVNEDSIDGKTIDVELSNGTLVSNLTKANWMLSNLPEGVDFKVDRIDGTHARITLLGERTSDFDSNRTITVSMSSKELVGEENKTYIITDDFAIAANSDKETITIDATNIDMATNEFTVELSGGEFVKDKLNKIIISGDIVSGGYVKLDLVEYIDSTHIKIKLKDWKTYYEDLSLSINVPTEAYTDSTGDGELTADVTCNKSNVLPTANEIGSTPVTLTEANAYRLKGSLASNVVAGNRVDYFLNVAEDGEYTLTYTAKNNGGVANAIKVSKGNGVNIDGNLITYNLGNYYDATNSFKDTITLEAGKQTLRFEAVNPGFTLTSIKIEKKAQPIFISREQATTIKADEFYKGSNDKGYAIETKNDIKNIGCTVAGTYIDYSVNVAESGKYRVNLNYGTSVGGATAVLQTGDGKELGRLPLANNGSWNDFVNTENPMYVTLNKGIQTLRLYVDGDGFNYRTFTLEAVVDSGAPTITGKDGAVELGQKPDLFKVFAIVAIDDLDGNITSKAVIDDSKVDYNKVGEYEVKVSVTDDSGNLSEKIFKLLVKEDGTAPIIEGHNAIIAVDSEFDPIADLGLKVTDNKDGNITSKAVITHVVDTAKYGVFRVKVEATDNAGNKSERIFIVRVLDKGIIEAADVKLKVGETFDPLKDVKAYDIDGEDLTSTIEILSNNVDTSKAGDYKVVYKIVDKDGNVVTFERSVKVEKVEEPGKPDPGDPTDPEEPGNPDPGDPTDPGKQPVTIITDENGNMVVEVSKISDKNGKNVIEVKNEGKDVIVEITDIEAIRDGKGSLEIKSDKVNISLPFSLIDSSLLTDGSKVIFKTSIENGNDLTKNIKGLKKIFKFNLSVVNGDNVIELHNLKDGLAKITIKLTEDELKGLDKSNLAVFYYNEETNKFEIMDTKINGNEVIFTTSHFSKFIVAEKASNGSNGEVLPQTGGRIDMNGLLALGLMATLAGIFVIKRNRKESL